MKYLSIVSLVFFSSFCLQGQTVEEYMQMARDKVANEDYQYASVLVDKAIKLDEENSWLLLEKATLQIKLRDAQGAIGSINKAIAIDTTASEPYNRAGALYESINATDQAIDMYNKAMSHAENDTIRFMYLSNRGSSKLGKRDYKAAQLDFEEVLEFNPKDTAALNNIASAYDELGMTDEAIATLQKLAKIDPSGIGAHVNLGFIYTQHDKLEEAIEAFNKALEIDPNEALVYSNRGYTFYKLKEYDKALADINKSIELYPGNSYAYRNLALVYLDLGKTEDACFSLKYAKDYGFAYNYGEEVNELIAKHCAK